MAVHIPSTNAAPYLVFLSAVFHHLISALARPAVIAALSAEARAAAALHAGVIVAVAYLALRCAC